MRGPGRPRAEGPLDGLQDLLRVPGWSDRAACDPKRPDLWWPTQAAGDNTEALRICRGCPVRKECAAYALDGHETGGIWGGVVLQGRDPRTIARHLRRVALGLGEPDDIRKLPARKRPSCGTQNGYQAHHREHEYPCQPCRDANAAYRRKHRASKGA